MSEPAQSLDEVLNNLDRIVDSASRNHSRLGYFPAMYRQVTREVDQRSQSGFFDHPKQLRALTVDFANRYLLAYGKYQQNEEVPEAWRVTFNATDQWWPIVLQHLLLGMNAHINFDLGLATVQTVAPQQWTSFREDFQRINDILGNMIDDVQERLAEIWPTMKLLDWWGQRIDETIMNFKLQKAREQAWTVAKQLARMHIDQRNERIQRLDKHTANLGRLILHPGFTLSSVNKIIRIGEQRNVADMIIDFLQIVLHEAPNRAARFIS